MYLKIPLYYSFNNIKKLIMTSFSYDDFVSNLVKRCNIPERSLNKNAIITYESDIIKLCFMYESQFSFIIKLKNKKVIKEIKICQIQNN